MKITKLFFIALLVASTFSMSILFGCSSPMNRIENRFTEGLGMGPISALAFSPNGMQLAVAGSEGLWIYDTQAIRPPVVIKKEGKVRALAWSDQGLAIGSDSTIALWNADTEEWEKTFDGGAEALVFVGNTWIFCVAYKYKNINGWNIRTEHRHPKFPKPIPQPGTSVFMTGDHSITNISPGAFFNREKQKPGYKRITQTGIPSAAAFAPNSIWALALKDEVSDNRKVTVNNVRVRVHPTEEKPYNIAEKMKTPVTAMAFSADSNILATSGRTETEIQLWNVKTGKLLQTLTTETDRVTALAFSMDGVLACGSRKGKIYLWK